MIRSLKGKWAKKIWVRQSTKKMLGIYELAWESLSLLDSIIELEQLNQEFFNWQEQQAQIEQLLNNLGITNPLYLVINL